MSDSNPQALKNRERIDAVPPNASRRAQTPVASRSRAASKAAIASGHRSSLKRQHDFSLLQTLSLPRCFFQADQKAAAETSCAVPMRRLCDRRRERSVLWHTLIISLSSAQVRQMLNRAESLNILGLPPALIRLRVANHSKLAGILAHLCFYVHLSLITSQRGHVQDYNVPAAQSPRATSRLKVAVQALMLPRSAMHYMLSCGESPSILGPDVNTYFNNSAT